MVSAKHIRPLGEFERAVMLAVLRNGSHAYGINIRTELQERLKRPVSLGAVYTTLDRLAEKGMVSSFLGDPTPERGGRAKKFFAIEARGVEALRHSRRTSEAIWAISPLTNPK